MAFTESCLFCGDEIGETNGLLNAEIPSETIPDLETLCTYLQISPEDAALFETLRPYFNGDKQVSCLSENQAFYYEFHPKLCDTCFGKVDALGQLAHQLDKIQRRVDGLKRDVRQVILQEGLEGDNDQVEGKEEGDNNQVEVKEEVDEDPEAVTPTKLRKLVKTFVDQEMTVAEEPVVAEPEEDVEVEDENEMESTWSEEQLEQWNNVTVTYSDNDDMNDSSLWFGSEDGFGGSIEETVSPENDDSSSPGKTKSENPTIVNESFSCRYCQQVLPSMVDYYNHRKSEHPERFNALSQVSLVACEDCPTGYKWQCSLCSTLLPDDKLTSVVEHMAMHENDISSVSISICPQCYLKFSLDVNVDLHRISCHETRVSIVCAECGDDSATSREEFIRHLTRHNGNVKVASCKSCPVSCFTLDALLTHIKDNHGSGEKELPCPECDSSFTSHDQLSAHCLDQHHLLYGTFRCKFCPQVFRRKPNLEAHFRSGCNGNGSVVATTTPTNVPNMLPITPPLNNIPWDHEGPVECELCPGKQFKNMSTLENHRKIIHTSDESKRFQCPHCPKGFVHHVTLKHHVEQIHQKIRYYCTLCPKSFTGKGILRDHMKLHVLNGGPAKVTCKICLKDYSCKPSLKAHMKAVHQQSVPEICDVCGKEFSNVYNLRAHRFKVHNIRKRKGADSGEERAKTFECEYCPKKFGTVGGLERHTREYHGDDVEPMPVQVELMEVGELNGFSVLLNEGIGDTSVVENGKI